MCVCNIRRSYRLRELYEADFHKPGIYRSGKVWANACDVFRRMPSRIGRGRRAAVDFVVCFGGADFFPCFFFVFFFFERTRPASSMRPHFASFTSLLVLRQSRGSEATEVFFFLREKKPLHTEVRTGGHYLISLSVRLSVCVTLVVFTDCESCTRPISANPGSMEAGECVGRVSLHAVWSWTRSPGCCGFRGVFWVGRIFSCFFSCFFLFRTHTACCKYEATFASFSFLLVMRQGRGCEATEAVLCL